MVDARARHEGWLSVRPVQLQQSLAEKLWLARPWSWLHRYVLLRDGKLEQYTDESLQTRCGEFCLRHGRATVELEGAEGREAPVSSTRATPAAEGSEQDHVLSLSACGALLCLRGRA